MMMKNNGEVEAECVSAKVVERAFEWMSTASFKPGKRLDHLGVSLGRLEIFEKVSFTVGILPESHRGPGLVFTFYNIWRDGVSMFRGAAGMSSQEVSQLKEWVSTFARVVDEWNGVGCDGVSFQVDVVPSYSIQEAVRLYYDSDPFSSNGPDFVEEPDFTEPTGGSRSGVRIRAGNVVGDGS